MEKCNWPVEAKFQSVSLDKLLGLCHQHVTAALSPLGVDQPLVREPSALPGQQASEDPRVWAPGLRGETSFFIRWNYKYPWGTLSCLSVNIALPSTEKKHFLSVVEPFCQWLIKRMGVCGIKEWVEQKIQMKINSLLSNRSSCDDGNGYLPAPCGCHRARVAVELWKCGWCDCGTEFKFYLISDNLNLWHCMWLVSFILDSYDPPWVMVNGWVCPLLSSSSPNGGFVEKGHFVFSVLIFSV